MPVGIHPNMVNGALEGILVMRQIVPAIGEPFIETQGEDEQGQPVTLQAPNPDYVAPQDTTLATLQTAVQGAEVELRGDAFESGNAPDGQAKVAFWITVGDGAAEAARRAAIDAACAQFAP